jgi:ABC-type multidrug transport system fused ATPase/permease subunit
MEILQNRQWDIRAGELTKIHKDIEDADDKVAHTMFFIFNVPRLFVAISRIGILYFIGYNVFYDLFTITDFALAMTVLIMFETFLIDSVEFYKNFTKDFSDIESLWKTIDSAPTMIGYEEWKTFKSNKWDIELYDITYWYGDNNIFESLSLTIKQWQKTALVGASGWGKTTLMKLIAGYLHPDNGYISILWNRLDETALKSYYPHIGYLTQDPGVFDATIRENLVSAVSDISQNQPLSFSEGESVPKRSSWSEDDKKKIRHKEESKESLEEKLNNALKLAHCDFVWELDNWLDTEIGERGIRLSGWQKQRLAIAKIFLKDPEIILLDEPTSALDSFSEEHITTALDELFQWRTVIVIAHRLQTVKKADEIIVLEWWSVVERWNHTELVEKWWIYNRMLELQSWF